ncbi:MAG: polysaccharide deacetylase, partial [Methylocystis sp.]
MNLNLAAAITARKAPGARFIAGVALLFAALLPLESGAQDRIDRVASFERESIHTAAWPAGKKVAVSFAFFVEEFGFGQGPIFRPDLVSRKPDLVNEA